MVAISRVVIERGLVKSENAEQGDDGGRVVPSLSNKSSRLTGAASRQEYVFPIPRGRKSPTDGGTLEIHQ
jgi:hypothetical protein